MGLHLISIMYLKITLIVDICRLGYIFAVFNGLVTISFSHDSIYCKSRLAPYVICYMNEYGLYAVFSTVEAGPQ